MNRFKRLSIRTQVLIIGLFIIAMIPVMLFNSYNQASKIIVKQSTQYNDELVSILQQRVSMNYAHISNLMTNLGYDTTVQQFMAESDDLKIYELSKKVESLLGVVKSTNKDIIDIVIVTRSNKHVSLGGRISYALDIRNNHPVGGSVHYGGFRQAEQGNDLDKLLFGMNIFSSGGGLPYGELAGYMAIVLDVKSIHTELTNYPRLAGTRFFMYDHQELIYVHDNADAPMLEKARFVLDHAYNLQASTITLQGSRYIVEAHPLPEIEGRIVTATPVSSLMKELDPLKSSSMLLFIIALLLVSIPYTVLTMNILKPLTKLMSFMKRTKSEDLTLLQSKVTLEGYAEMEVISYEFNTMMERIHELTNQLVLTSTQLFQLELEKERVKMAFLQSQINPHFLSNTLDSIKGMALAKGNREIYEMTSALSRMLRYTIKGTDEVTLAEELQIVQAYITIHRIRFAGRFQYELDCPEKLLGASLPKMIIQPLVENALSHGLDTLAEGGVIRITIRETDLGDIEISVADNGQGIEPGRLEQLHALLASEDALLNKNIGIRNVNNRIKLRYGTDYGMSLRSELGQGTEVTLLLPLEMS